MKSWLRLFAPILPTMLALVLCGCGAVSQEDIALEPPIAEPAGSESAELLGCYEGAEKCYPDGSRKERQCEVRCCNGASDKKRMLCGACRGWGDDFCVRNRSSVRYLRWSP